MNYLLPALQIYFCIIIVSASQCYWNTECKYKYFSSKTPYEIVRGDIRDTIIKTEGCEPVSVWAIVRHGKRNPGNKFARNIMDVLNYKDIIVSKYESGNSSICAQDIENLKNWRVDPSFLNEQNEIASEGFQELERIGNRLKGAFPELLNNFGEEDFLFQPAFGHRMEVSGKAFIKGLNDTKIHLNRVDIDNRIVAPYTSCGKYQKEVMKNPGIYYEVEKYIKTVDYLNMIERVNTRLGLNFSLTYENIIALHDVCRYPWKGIENIHSPWCAVFSDEDLKVLEYIGDLEHYYRNGYGAYNYSHTFGKITLADLLNKFEEAKNGKGKKIVVYFTHATMMDMVLVGLDLYKDVNPITGAHRDINRKWRTTFLSTFAANLIAVLNRCQKIGENGYDYKVTFYWNEEPVLDMCDQGVCSWQEFEDKFKPFLNTTANFCEFKWLDR